MNASQYKDDVLVLLFIKYVSDKYAGVPFVPITIPSGASFKDMVALEGKSDIGDQINKKIIAPLANANKLSDLPDFNDATTLGTGKDSVIMARIIGIREARGEALDLKAYEADMRHLIDTYIEADEPRKTSPFDNKSLLDLIVKTGIANAIAAQLGGMKGNKKAVAETIENNVRSKMAAQDPPLDMALKIDEAVKAKRPDGWRGVQAREQVIKAAVSDLIARWAPMMGVKVKRVFIQKMKTKWESCNPGTRSIRLNTDLAKKPARCLEYIVVHEMAQLLERHHNDRFTALMDEYLSH